VFSFFSCCEFIFEKKKKKPMNKQKRTEMKTIHLFADDFLDAYYGDSQVDGFDNTTSRIQFEGEIEKLPFRFYISNIVNLFCNIDDDSLNPLLSVQLSLVPEPLQLEELNPIVLSSPIEMKMSFQHFKTNEKVKQYYMILHFMRMVLYPILFKYAFNRFMKKKSTNY
jgi:hypothetical protein